MTISNVFAFDIETVPDVEFGRRLHGLEGLTDKQVGYVMQTRQREETGSEFLSVEQHRIVAIAVALRTGAGFEARSIGETGTPEAELLQYVVDYYAYIAEWPQGMNYWTDWGQRHGLRVRSL